MRYPALVFCLLGMMSCFVLAQADSYVGTEVCLECHDDSDLGTFDNHSHFLAMQAKGLTEKACEGCHGPGMEHSEDPMPENIFGKDRLSDISKQCSSCHPQYPAATGFAIEAHVRSDVGCLSCHGSGHDPSPAQPMLAMAQPDLCGQCHVEPVLSFNAPFTHRSGHKPVACNDCHPSHAETTMRSLIESPGRSTCVKCHSDKAGPFVFPHPGHGLDGCESCHAPHGSPNPFFLTRADVNQLCLECHIDTPTFHDLTRPRYRSCTACHSAVHGSQRDSNLFEE